MKKHLSILILALVCTLGLSAATPKQPLKVFAIGNSFSVDAVEQNLHEICAAADVDIIIGNMYIGGCSIERHCRSIEENIPDYSYRKIGLDGVLHQRDGVTLPDCIKDEDWDIITVQQCSPLSGLKDSYVLLSQLLSWVRSQCPRAKILFHQTWAYAKDSDHPDFPRYNKDQALMYKSIMRATKVVEKQYKLPIIPCGTAIQNARGTILSKYGDELTRDGFHLEYKMGRYIAAATWFEALTGKSVLGNGYALEGFSPAEMSLAQKAAHKASCSPFKTKKL